MPIAAGDRDVAGIYRIWGADLTQANEVTIAAGAVAEVDWRRGTGAE